MSTNFNCLEIFLILSSIKRALFEPRREASIVVVPEILVI